jgi:hypothetical protein
MLIRGLVYDDTEAEALLRAKEDVFESLVEEGVFEEYATPDMKDHSLHGCVRPDELPEVARSTSDLGEELIRNGWKATAAETRENLAWIKKFFDDHEMQEFWNSGEVHGEYKYAFNKVGEYRGSSVYLYDQDGQGILTREHLDQVLNHWDSCYDSLEDNPLMDQNLYVVPGYVRY